MKTLIIRDDSEFVVSFAVIEGNFSHLDGLCLYSDEEPDEKRKSLIDEATELLCGNNIELKTDAKILMAKNWDYVAIIQYN